MSVFIVLVGDGWSNLYTQFTKACGSTKSTLFFLSLLIFGKYIILNLFIAILILNFEEESMFELKDVHDDALMILEKPTLTFLEKFLVHLKHLDDKITNCCLERRRRKSKLKMSMQIDPNFKNL